MAELHEAVAVEPQPRDIALLGRPHQRRRAGPERPRLRIAYEAVALLREIPVRWRRIARLYVVGQQAQQELQRQGARLPADRLVLVLEHHVVDARLAFDRSRAAVGDRRAGDVLQLDRHVFHDVPQPGALVLAQAPHEAAGLLVGAAVLVQARQCLEQRLDEGIAEAAGRPRLEFAEIDDVPDDPEVGPDIRTNVDVGADDFHCCSPVVPLVGRARARLPRNSIEAPACDQDVHLYTDQAHRIPPPRLIH